MLPFTKEVFLRVFEQYNAAIWPAQVVAYGLGVLLVLLTLKPRRGSDRVIAAALAGIWLWMGVVYQVMYYSTINWAAWAFGALFLIQGLLVAWTGAVRGRLEFRFVPDLHGWVGFGFMVFSMAVYPLIGLLTDYDWLWAPMFGVAPNPTTIFTLGMLLLIARRVPLHLLVIPVFWSLIGGATAWLLNVPRDLALPLAGVSTVWLVLWKNRRMAVGER